MRRTHPHAEAEHGEADAVAEAGGRQEPGARGRCAFAAHVVDDELRRLSVGLCSARPLGPALFAQRAIEGHDELQAALVQAGLRQRRQVAEHGVPLAAAHPVGLVAAVESLQARICVHEDARGRRRRRGQCVWVMRMMVGMGMMMVVVVVWGISARSSTQFEEIYWHRSARAPLLQILLKSLHSHIFVLRSCLRLKSVCARARSRCGR